jgi:hypothetical protein
MKMSEFIQKHKYNIQIAVEVTCIIGILLYVRKTNNTLTEHIANLNERLLVLEHAVQSKQVQQPSRPLWVATPTPTPPRPPKRKTRSPPMERIVEVVEEEDSEDDEELLDAEIDAELNKMKLKT